MTQDNENKGKTNSDSGNGEALPFHKRQEFMLYRIWYSLPAHLKGMDQVMIRQKMGFEDETHLALLNIRTQKEFAETYKLSPDTLTDWNRYINKHYDPFEEIKEWSTKLIKNVVSSTYNSSLQRDPKANADRKLFLQLQGWVEETKQVHKVENFTDLIRGALNGRDKRTEGGSGSEDQTGSGVVSKGDSGDGAVGEATGDNQLG